MVLGRKRKMIGPAERISIGGEKSAALYLLRFDKHGRLQSPQTAEAAIQDAKSASDVFVFSHGWNNIYADALTRYRDFANGFVAQRGELDLPVPADYRPMLIGVIWPATWFVLDSEEGPGFAAGGLGGSDYEQMLAEVVEGMKGDDEGAELTELLDGHRVMSEESAARAAELIRSALWEADDTDAAASPPDVATVLSSWRRIAGEGQPYVEEDETIGTVGAPADQTAAGEKEADAANANEPGYAGWSGFDPRGLLRMGSVWRMKARAGP